MQLPSQHWLSQQRSHLRIWSPSWRRTRLKACLGLPTTPRLSILPRRRLRTPHPSPNRRTRQMTGNRRRPKSPRFSIPIKSPWRAKRRLSNGARLRFPILSRAARACCLRPPIEYLIWMERTPISCCPRGSAGRWVALRISPMLAARRRQPLPGLTPTRCDTRVPSNWCASAGSSAGSNCKGVLKPAAGWDTLHFDRLSWVLRSRAGIRCAP